MTGSSNPWLAIPLDAYEGHMKSEGVRQLDALADLFGEALEFCRPRSVAILGVAGGNGLERIDPTVTRRVVGLDINPAYLGAARRRFRQLAGLELHCIDLATEAVALAPVELVHAALIFEHAGTGRCLENALSLAAPCGRLAAVLQLPGEEAAAVASSSYASMQALAGHFSLVGVDWFRTELERRGLALEHEARRLLPGGKGFWLGVFGRAERLLSRSRDVAL